ncbi:MAG: NAD(P)/FAD-dependent oxidoreductase [Euryarchaeota archaeon]
MRDVIVVGAGPAGSMAAWAAARAGCDVLILERRAEVGAPKQCAEGISARALREAEVPTDGPWIAQEIRRGILAVPSPDGLRTFEAEGIHGYVLERKLFDRWLAARAVEEGAELRLLVEARGVLLEGGRVVGVKTSEGRVRAEVVIAADGIESRVGRSAGLVPPLRPDELCTCAQYEVVGRVRYEDAFAILFDPDRVPGGYAWTFPKGADRANVGVGCRGRSPRKLLDELLRGPLSRLVEGARPVELNVGGVPVCGPLERTYDDGILVVGDAARQVNPLTGGGLNAALICGRIAGEVAAEAVSEGDPSAERLREYQERWEKELGETFEVAREAAEAVVGTSTEEVLEFLEGVEEGLEEVLRSAGVLERQWWG